LIKDDGTKNDSTINAFIATHIKERYNEHGHHKRDSFVNSINKKYNLNFGKVELKREISLLALFSVPLPSRAVVTRQNSEEVDKWTNNRVKKKTLFPNNSFETSFDEFVTNNNVTDKKEIKDMRRTLHRKTSYFQDLGKPDSNKDKNLLKAKKTNNEKINALVTITTSIIPNKEKINIKIKILNDSNTKISNKNLSLSSIPCIPLNSEISSKIALPSVMKADPDMILVFFENLLENIYIEHDRSTNRNKCHI
jgi:hypothetical protein